MLPLILSRSSSATTTTASFTCTSEHDAEASARFVMLATGASRESDYRFLLKLITNL